MSKTILIAGVVLLVSIGGIFLFFNQTEIRYEAEESEHSSLPAEWSQEGDYEIQETPEGTVVRNEKAGFSFKAPANWRLEGEEGSGIGEYFLNIFSPDSKLNDNNLRLVQGCGISLNTFYQEFEWSLWTNRVLGYQEDPENRPQEDEIVVVGNYQGVKTTLIAETDKTREVFGDNLQVRVPILNNGVVEFGMTIMPEHQSDCTTEFESLISSFSTN